MPRTGRAWEPGLLLFKAETKPDFLGSPVFI
jgi:hypothetical protein